MRTLTFHRVIGIGGMGTVYHAELRATQGFTRQCAVKVMRTSSPDQEHFRARMRDEARLLGMLRDEQILGVSELVQVSGYDCVVMEYVKGVDLADLIKVRTLPSRALAELGAELAGTVHRAHQAEHPTTGEPLHVIHRDVKPANVMITDRGGVRLLDFGVARAAFAARESHTQGLVLGTLNYFPPEILAGGAPTPAVDIYGVGITLWECATGRDWGSPQVHRYRFERRVEQRLGEVGDDYSAIVPVLRQLLLWDPTTRPNGGDVEQSLLKIVDACSGEGLRSWARYVVPPILEERLRSTTSDDLVGKTLPIEGSQVVNGPQPLTVQPPIPPGGGSLEEETFNDLAPPAAVRRVEDDLLLPGGPAAPVKASEAATPTPAPGAAHPRRQMATPEAPNPAPASESSLALYIGIGAVVLLMVFAVSVALLVAGAALVLVLLSVP